MYRLYPIDDRSKESRDYLIQYDWAFLKDNREWRDCVSHFLDLTRELGYTVEDVEAPPFEPHEDFVGISCRINQQKVVFSCDSLLSLILFWTDGANTFTDLWELVGNKVGWAR